jgi:uncharacterized membrane-anchored protein
MRYPPGAALAAVAAAYDWTSVSRTLLFWAAFIPTRPLGATVGDFLDKPLASVQRDSKTWERVG